MQKLITTLLLSVCLLVLGQNAFAIVSTGHGAISSDIMRAKSASMKHQFNMEKKTVRMERLLQRFHKIDFSDHTQKWLYLSIFTMIAAILLQLLYKAVSFGFIISLANTFAVVAIIFFVVWLIKRYA